MEKIFYTDKRNFATSLDAVRYLLFAFYNVETPRFARTESGKPYLENMPLHFSVSHIDEHLFIAVSERNIGLDAEDFSRTTNYSPIIKKFSKEEQNEIHSMQTFLKHWIAKESVIKWMGGSIAHDLYRLSYAQEKIFYNQLELPVHLQFIKQDEVVLCLCFEGEMDEVDLVPFPQKKTV